MFGARGLTEDEYLELYGRNDTPTIIKVLDFGTGWISVRLSDGTKQVRSEGSISWRYHNPGNLKFGPFAKSYGAVDAGWGGHAIFPSRYAGQMTKRALLFSSEKYRSLSVYDAISKYAPEDDNGAGVPTEGNQPRIYTNYICKQVGTITPDTILETMDNQEQDAMLSAMLKFEGFMPGKVSTS